MVYPSDAADLCTLEYSVEIASEVTTTRDQYIKGTVRSILPDSCKIFLDNLWICFSLKIYLKQFFNKDGKPKEVLIDPYDPKYTEQGKF